jgi:hypothetical protein
MSTANLCVSYTRRTVPESIADVSLMHWLASLENTAAPSPYTVELASSTASASFSNVVTLSTGPKILPEYMYKSSVFGNLSRTLPLLEPQHQRLLVPTNANGNTNANTHNFHIWLDLGEHYNRKTLQSLYLSIIETHSPTGETKYPLEHLCCSPPYKTCAPAALPASI